MNSKLINLFLWVCSVLKMGCLKIPTRTLVFRVGWPSHSANLPGIAYVYTALLSFMTQNCNMQEEGRHGKIAVHNALGDKDQGGRMCDVRTLHH